MHCPSCGFGVSPMLAACPRCGAPLPPPPGAVMVAPRVATPIVAPPPPDGFAELGGLALTVMTSVVVSALVTVVGSAWTAFLGAAHESESLGFFIWATGWSLRVPVFAFFIVWLYRARLNLDLFPGVKPQWRSEWTALCWIMPFANLVLPGAVIADVARNSVDDYEQAVDRVSRLAWAWWIFVPLPPVLDLVVNTFVPRFIVYPGLPYQLGLVAPGIIATLVSLVLTNRLVGTITRAQHDRIGPIRHFAVVTR
jgi:Domain of unknown function (DUF4328)